MSGKRLRNFLACISLIAILLTSCQSGDSKKREFEKVIQQTEGCNTAAQCAVLYTECPLGCYHAVALSAQHELSELAEEMGNDHRKA